jgi:aminomethyltransferase
MQVRASSDTGKDPAAGAAIGEVTSGTFSPTLRTGIALALIATDAGVQDGDELALDVRGRVSAVRVVRPPFVESHVR